MSVNARAAILRTLSRHSSGTWVAAACAVAVLLLSILDNAGAFGYGGSDWRRFDQKQFRVARCVDGARIIVADQARGETAVKLLGVDAPKLPDAHWAEKSRAYTAARTSGRTVTLRLDPICTRTEDGALPAYVFISDGDNLNADIIRDGQAYADRRVKHTFASQFSVAENEARKKPRGLWVDLREEQMPQWRREWLKSLKE
jgi:endonuclease YncB( thermonuclease family)